LYEAQVLLQDISAPALIQSIDDTLIHIWYEIVALWENPKSYNPINLSNYLERLDTVNATRQMSTLLGSVIYLAKVNQLDSLLEVSTNILSRFSEAYLHPIAVDCYHLPRLRKYLQSIDVWTVIEPIYRKLTDSIVSQITLRDTNKLELIMLGCDVVIWQGVALQDTSWVSPQARELFYCLYFFGAQNKSQLARRLWNDHSDYQVRNSLRAAKQRLDDTLPNVIVYQNDAYRFNPEIKVKSDVVLFEETVRSAGRLLARDARAEELYLRAISMYNELGLLPTLFGDWIQPLRDKYERLYRQALEGATKCYIARNDFTGTIMLLESQLSIDPYDESVYQSLMSCHAKNKQFAKVQLTFDRLTRVLATLDLIPQSETVQLLNLLLI
jgi:DNA-binding SARP family transcriptional activator